MNQVESILNEFGDDEIIARVSEYLGTRVSISSKGFGFAYASGSKWIAVSEAQLLGAFEEER